MVKSEKYMCGKFEIEYILSPKIWEDFIPVDDILYWFIKEKKKQRNV